MAIIKQGYLDINEPTQYFYMRVKQGDKFPIKLVLTLVNGSGIYIIPPLAFVNIRMIKPDGKIINNGCVVENNNVVIDFNEQMLIKEGLASAEINIVDHESDTTITTPKFKIIIDKSIFSDVEITSESEFGVLREALIKAERFGTAISYCQTTALNTIKVMDEIWQTFNGMKQEMSELIIKSKEQIEQMTELMNKVRGMIDQSEPPQI